MLDLLKFSISAADKFSPKFGKLQTELKGVKGALAGVSDYANRTGRGLRNIGAGMSAGITAPLVGMMATAKSSAQSLRDLNNESRMAGLDASQFTILSLASEEFGVEQSKLSDILKDVNDKFGDFAATGAGPLRDFFDNIAPQVGLTEKAFEGLSSSDSLRKYIGALEDAGASQAQMTFYMEALASDATLLLPVFGKGGEAIDGMAAAAKNLGLVIDADLLSSAADVERDFRVAGRVMGIQFKQALISLAPAIGTAAKELAPLLEKVRDGISWFQALSPEVKKNIVVFGGIAAAAGPVLAFFGAAVLGITALTGAFTSMAAVLLANPIGLAIAAVAAGAYLIYRNWEGISGWFQGLWGRVKSVTGTAWEGIKSALLNYTPAGLIYKNWDSIGTWFSVQWLLLKAEMVIAWDAIKGLLSGTYSPQQLIYDLWQGIDGWFSSLAPKVKAAFVTIWEAVKEEVSSWPGKMLQMGKDAVQGLIDGLFAGKEGVRSAGRNVARDLTKSAKTELDSHSPSRVFMQIGRDVASGLGIGINQNADAALTEAQSLAKGVAKVGEASLGFMGTVRDGAKTIFRDVLTGAQSFMQSLNSVLSAISSRLIDAGISGIFDAIWPFANGGVVSGGRQMAFANGGVVNGPTYFGMQGGTGLMGEAGPEAILPLGRVGGKLGVRAAGGGSGPVTVSFTVNAQGAQEGVAKQIEDALREFAPAVVKQAVSATYARSREVAMR